MKNINPLKKKEEERTDDTKRVQDPKPLKLSNTIWKIVGILLQS